MGGESLAGHGQKGRSAQFCRGFPGAENEPQFAVNAGIAALRWLVAGYGYEISGLAVQDAYNYTMKAAENAGCKSEAFEYMRELVARETFGERFITRILGR